MLIAIFYPLIDGGISQTLEVYHGLRSGRLRAKKNKADDATPDRSSAEQDSGVLQTSDEHVKRKEKCMD